MGGCPSNPSTDNQSNEWSSNQRSKQWKIAQWRHNFFTHFPLFSYEKRGDVPFAPDFRRLYSVTSTSNLSHKMPVHLYGYYNYNLRPVYTLTHSLITTWAWRPRCPDDCPSVSLFSSTSIISSCFSASILFYITKESNIKTKLHQ